MLDDSTFTLEEVGEALDHLEAGKATGKVVAIARMIERLGPI